MNDANCINEIIAKEKCPDNNVGTVTITEDGEISAEDLYFSKDKRIEFSDNRYVENINEAYPNIVIVLESPHKDEYSNGNFIAPALGRTGTNLQEYFTALLSQIRSDIKPIKYNVILMNAVQYQCSKGESLKGNEANRERTDRILKCLWEDGQRECFEARLKSYKPVIVINSCTGKIEKNESIKHLLQNSINNATPKAYLYRSPHPSSLWFKKGYINRLN